MDDLTPRQMQILDYIRREVKAKNYPPSVREIGQAVGLSSSSTVHAHLAKLESKGYIRRDPTKPRALELIDDDPSPTVVPDVVSAPVVGHVTAGEPILAEQNIEEYFPLPKMMVHQDNVFLLRVRGDSMINAGIMDGDLVIVRQQSTASNGEIIVAMLEGEATVKRFYKEKDHIRLQPENDLYEPLRSPHISIIGKVIGVFRHIH
ncbi:transcriptional repressor LexA [Dethiobacter alkaliphilus]|uniref:LexA repressor n=1 Tax=Dethiobacter alkaliphilus AHT 1 TaxID=555088 RepID=C0GDS0_DETAL|nr:transcriptional repressor LexA [Dethiobacter alkaliphilus]EEG78553.1 SOS-response transcriptional repressor, LexA [Dethiobacter alkaliphilus AHT 1]